MKKLFSIIIPTYNEEKCIEMLLRSLRRQTFSSERVEVIIVDNGSLDKTIHRIKAYSQRYSRPIIHLSKESNKHVSSARNKGAKIAKGEFLVFLDADNIVHEEFLEEIYNFILKGYKAGTICTLALEDSSKGHILFLLLECIKILCNKPFGKNFCSRDIFRRVGGYNETISIGTNVDFLTRVKKYLAMEKKSLAHIQKPIYASLRRFENSGYGEVLFKWFCGYIGIRKIAY